VNCAICTDPSANHTTEQHEQAARIVCYNCHDVYVKDEDEMCSECISEMAEYYTPDKGGEG